MFINEILLFPGALLNSYFFQENRWRTHGSTSPTLRASWSPMGVSFLSLSRCRLVASLTEACGPSSYEIHWQVGWTCGAPIFFFKSFLLCVALNLLNFRRMLNSLKMARRSSMERTFNRKSLWDYYYRACTRPDIRPKASGATYKLCIYRRDLAYLYPSNLAVWSQTTHLRNNCPGTDPTHMHPLISLDIFP